MSVFEFEVTDNNNVMKTQSGMVETFPPYGQPDGHVEFRNVQWDYCYVYLLGTTGNIGTFSGEKLYLRDFLRRFKHFRYPLRFGCGLFCGVSC